MNNISLRCSFDIKLVSFNICICVLIVSLQSIFAFQLIQQHGQHLRKSFHRMPYGSIHLEKSTILSKQNTNTLFAATTTSSEQQPWALLFDCDGVIVETEELHRIAYNKAFEHYGLKFPNGEKVHWDVAYYDILQNTVGGGKPKMKYFFTKTKGQWPVISKPYTPPPKTEAEKNGLIDRLQDRKTKYYVKIVEEVATARPGVLGIMDAAIKDPLIKVGICSAATKEGFLKLADSIVGPDRLNRLDVVMAGDDVKEKKPHAMIYDLAKNRIGIPSERCLVIEDSIVGLKAAKAAHMKCVVTYTPNTANEDFTALGADLVLPNLADVTLDDLKRVIFPEEVKVVHEEIASIQEPSPKVHMDAVHMEAAVAVVTPVEESAVVKPMEASIEVPVLVSESVVDAVEPTPSFPPSPPVPAPILTWSSHFMIKAHST